VYHDYEESRCKAVFPSWIGDRDIFIVIDCGLDESESSKGILVVSAVVGQTSHMRKLATNWKKDLEISNVDFFHAKEHWNRKSKPYHGLSNRKRKQLLLSLIGHIRKFAYRGISVSIDPKEYRTLTTNRFRSNWGAPYSFAVQMLMLLIYFDLEARKREHEVVNFLLEDGHANVVQAEEIIRGAGHTKAPFLNVGSCGRGGKLNNPILQSADLLAYGNCQYVSTGDSQIYRQLVGRTSDQFFRFACDKSLIEQIKRDINDTFERRRELRLKA
jgi:hypothetical protein